MPVLFHLLPLELPNFHDRNSTAVSATSVQRRLLLPYFVFEGLSMDLETENRIAAILMKEAAELRRQAERDGVDAYLRSPNVRGRPNSRFLTATVLGVQQANRVVEVNEMWRVRQKEKELDDRAKKDEKRATSHRISDSQRSTSARIEDYERKGSSICSSSKRSSENDGLRDNEIEEFLHSRVKRGRGAVGSRMDETGPYLPGSKGKRPASPDVDYRENSNKRVVLAPQKPLNLQSGSSSDEESSGERGKHAKRAGSSKHHHRKRISEEKSDAKKKKKKKRDKKRSKHHKSANEGPTDAVSESGPLGKGQTGSSAYGYGGLLVYQDPCT